MKYKIGFIGCGNMGGALIKAASVELHNGEIAVFDKDGTKTSAMQERYGAVPTTLEDLAENSEFVVLGVKPQIMAEALAPIAKILQNRKDVTVVTMAAGLSMSAIRGFIGANLPMIRIMPNTPVTVNEGMILYVTADISAAAHDTFRAYFAHAGKFDLVTEAQLDAGGALSGCGPAFAYAFAEALAEGAIECGVPEDKAVAWTAQTLLGAANMLLEFGDPVALRKAVCSPNGTTLAGVAAMQENGFHNAAKSAVLAAYKRTLELKK